MFPFQHRASTDDLQLHDDGKGDIESDGIASSSEERVSLTTQLSEALPSTHYGSLNDDDDASTPLRSIRFQVVVWYIGPIDVVLGKVDVRFRVTVFWNAPQSDDDQVGYGLRNGNNAKVWTMHGRQRAYRRELTEVMDGSRIVYVPPVSILNAIDFEVLGDPAEVCLLNEKTNLMRWSCLYKATLSQGTMHVGSFPHDVHEIVFRFGILKHRQSKKRWDKDEWKLALATEEDTQDSIETPHGLIVDQVNVPGFSHAEEGLEFAFVPLDIGRYGGKKGSKCTQDQCLKVTLRVSRDSSYYDRNIITMLAALNVVAVSTLALDPNKFGARGEIILATAFVEIGIRMTVDSHLPDVGYQIKIQVVLNNLFLGLLFLVLESSIVYVMYNSEQYVQHTGWMDRAAAVTELAHTAAILLWYYYHR